MRTTPGGIDTTIVQPKVANLNIKLVNVKPDWSSRVVDDSLGLSPSARLDMCVDGDGVARVVNFGDVLYRQDIPDLTAALYPNWVSTAIALKAGSRPGIEAGYYFYQKANGSIYKKSFAGVETLVTAAFAAFTCVLAPTANGVYIHYMDGSWGAISYVGNDAIQVPWTGRLYGNVPATHLDAATLNGYDYVYVHDDANRAVELRRSGKVWSSPAHVIPLDVLDTMSSFVMDYASVLNGSVYLTGRLTRTSDADPVSMDVVLRGPTVFGRGPEIFLAVDEAGAKVFETATGACALGVNEILTTEPRSYFGQEAIAYDGNGFIGVDYKESENSGSNIQLAVPLDMTVLAGQDIILEMGYDDDIMTRIGTCTVERVDEKHGEAGVDLTVGGRGASGRRLNRWNADQGIYIPGQASITTHPSSLDQVIRARGMFEVSGGPLVAQGLNQPGVLYSVARASSGGTCRGKFKFPDEDDFSPRYGVGINYYRETRYQAATRLGVTETEVTEAQYGDNAIIAIYGPTEHAGNPGIALYLWTASVFTFITSAALTIPANTWHFLQITFIDGLVTVHYRTTTAWQLVLSYLYTLSDRAPWASEQLGRACAYLENVTPNSEHLGFSSNGIIIPLENHGGFPTSDTVIVDDERINYTSKSPNVTAMGPLGISQDNMFKLITETFEGFPVVLETSDAVNADHSLIGCALTCVEGAGAGTSWKIVDYDAYAPPEWTPTGLYTPPDHWEDHVGQASRGSWGPSNKRRVYVSQNPSSVLGDDSKFKITEALNVSARGVGSTEAGTHSAGMISLWRNFAVKMDLMETFTNNIDLSLEDGLKYVAAVAGAPAPSFDRLALNPTVGAWGTSQWVERDSLAAEITLPVMTTGQETGLAFRAVSQVASAMDAHYVLSLANASDVYSLKLYIDGTLVETFPMTYVPSGVMRISVRDEVFSVWINGRYVHSFADGTYTRGYACLTASFAATITGYISATTELVDNITIGAGVNGSSAIEELLNGRNVRWCENEYGALFFYRNRTMRRDLPDIVCGYSMAENETVVSRVRAEGIKIAEVVDPVQLAIHGATYVVLNARHANTKHDVLNEARRFINETLRSRHEHWLDVVPHPAIQVGDAYGFLLKDGVVDIEIYDLNFRAEMVDNSLTWQMNLAGVDYVA